uniref:Endo/exonuclease/phosphatase domain-containing protein n=1 Tax=Meloidogyne hapla TaxID=6305 RepID=A0A1I8BL93_MELHA
MAKRNSSDFSPLNFATNSSNEKRSKIVEQINSLNFDKISTEMEADKTTPAWAKLLLGQMGSLLKIAAELLTEQTTTYGNFELHLKQQQQQIEENERQHCLVITGLEESNKQEAIARAKEDQEKVLEVINMCKVDIGLPTAVFRMDILEKFNIVLCNRTNRRGGGCALLIRKEIKFFTKHAISKFNSEIIHLQIQNAKCINFILIYRPPNTNITQTKKLFKYIESLISFNCIILGDFNFGNKDLNWVNNIPYSKNNIGDIFLNFFNISNLTSITSGPTRNDAYLDLLLTNKPELIHNIYNDGSLFDSDHEALLFDFVFPRIKKENRSVKYRQYTKTNTHLLNITLSSIISAISPQNFYLEDKYNCFINNIQLFLNLFIPEKIITRKDLTHDYPTHLKASIKKKAELYRLLKIDKLKYKEIYDSITLHIKIQTRNFHAKRQNAYITKNKNAIYKYINRFKFINNEIPVLYHNNKFITNAYDKAEIFANIFLENFSNINMQYNN